MKCLKKAQSVLDNERFVDLRFGRKWKWLRIVHNLTEVPISCIKLTLDPVKNTSNFPGNCFSCSIDREILFIHR